MLKDLQHILKLHPFLLQIDQAFPDAEIFVVGGAVRDTLLKRPIKDCDFVIRKVPLDKLESFLSTIGEVNAVGKRFGVLKFKDNDTKKSVDIALPRKEFSLSNKGIYKDFDIQFDPMMPMEEDLARRDFTINAMAYDIIHQIFVDPFFGQKDLDEKIVRTVGSAVTRFQEDYSRMLRALRFSTILDFSIAPQTLEAMTKMAHHVNDKIDGEWIVAREIVAKEFVKGFISAPTRWLDLADQTNLLEQILPEIKKLQTVNQSPPFHCEGNAFVHTKLALEKTTSPEFKKIFPEELPAISLLSILFHDIGKATSQKTDKDGIIHFYGHANTGAEIMKKILKNIPLSNASEHDISGDSLVWIIKNHLFSIDNNFNEQKLTKIEELCFSQSYPSQSLLHVMLADQLASIRENNQPSHEAFLKLWQTIQSLGPDGNLPKPLINGEDVLTWTKLEPGPRIKQLLETIRENQLNGTISSKNEAKTLIKSLL